MAVYSCSMFMKTCAPDGRSCEGIPPRGSRKINLSSEIGCSTGVPEDSFGECADNNAVNESTNSSAVVGTARCVELNAIGTKTGITPRDKGVINRFGSVISGAEVS